MTAPSPQDIIDFFASENAQLRLRYLLDANRENPLTDAERTEFDESHRGPVGMEGVSWGTKTRLFSVICVT
jgi:hypothetical protein